MDRDAVLRDFFNTTLKGESKTYDDHNWYTSSGLRGYISGSSSYMYPLLKKPLSQYTIGEIKAFQSKPRDATGQLWATGRYQIIPSTLKGIATKAGLSDSAVYNQVNQDRLAWELLMERPNLRNYIRGFVADNPDSLKAAALDMAKIWSSIGVPYPMQGSRQFVQTNQSYYAGGGDVASVSSEAIQQKLKQLRLTLGGIISGGIEFAKKRPFLTIILTSVFVTAVYILVKQLKTK
jgi:muramidase (phage lysozyme)